MDDMFRDNEPLETLDDDTGNNSDNKLPDDTGSVVPNEIPEDESLETLDDVTGTESDGELVDDPGEEAPNEIPEDESLETLDDVTGTESDGEYVDGLGEEAPNEIPEDESLETLDDVTGTESDGEYVDGLGEEAPNEIPEDESLETLDDVTGTESDGEYVASLGEEAPNEIPEDGLLESLEDVTENQTGSEVPDGSGEEIPDTIQECESNEGVDAMSQDDLDNSDTPAFVEEYTDSMPNYDTMDHPINDGTPGDFSDDIQNFFSPEAHDGTIPFDVENPENATETAADIKKPSDRWLTPPVKGMEAYEPSCDIKPLDKTAQPIRMYEADDGSIKQIFDHPDEMAKRLLCDQSLNSTGKDGCCALASTAAWLDAAGSNNKIDDVINFASTHSDLLGKPLCDDSGGVYPENLPAIWERFGIPADLDKSKNLETIADAVENGHAVSIGVNSGTFWSQDNPEQLDYSDYFEDGGANHAVSVFSVERDPATGSVSHFFVNDTGRGFERDACRRVPAASLIKAFCVPRGSAVISKNPVW